MMDEVLINWIMTQNDANKYNDLCKYELNNLNINNCINNKHLSNKHLNNKQTNCTILSDLYNNCILFKTQKTKKT